MYRYKSILDGVSLVDVANEFIDLQPDQKNSYGRFTDKDI